MSLYDSFIKHNGDDVQVKCFEGSMGGYMDCYYFGHVVPTYMVDGNGNILKEYGDNFNIFPYSGVEDDVILIRDGCYFDCIDYRSLLKAQTENVKCIDKFGNILDVSTPKDYRMLKSRLGR